MFNMSILQKESKWKKETTLPEFVAINPLGRDGSTQDAFSSFLQNAVLKFLFSHAVTSLLLEEYFPLFEYFVYFSFKFLFYSSEACWAAEFMVDTWRKRINNVKGTEALRSPYTSRIATCYSCSLN